jgi:hypothetical protein
MKNRTRARPRLNRLWILIISVMALPAVLLTVLVAVPVASPAAGAETADVLRAIFGPEPVAQLESLSYWMRDAIMRSLPATNSGRPQVNWSSGNPAAQGTAVSIPSPISTLTPYAKVPHANPVGQPDLTPAAGMEGAQVPPESNVVTASPQIGWQAYGEGAVGSPLMSRTIIMVDPVRSYAGVALVRMDLSGLSLHIMAGFLEPAHPSGIDKVIANLGMIPPHDQGQLAAAFNGGFKALHGHYGMMVNGITLLPPVDDMATVAVYQDGSVRMGAWGRDLFSSGDMIAFRQNCPPLIDAGEINPALSTDARRAWGFTNNSDVTWRTGLGITQDRRYLIYAVGNGTTAEFLAEAMQKAGAYMAMQLDINQYYAHFVTYSTTNDLPSSSGSQLIAEPLLDKMIDIRKLFLVPYPRDFFYLTLRE